VEWKGRLKSGKINWRRKLNDGMNQKDVKRKGEVRKGREYRKKVEREIKI